MFRKRISLFLLTVSLAVAAPAAAFAQSPPGTGYDETGVLEEIDTIGTDDAGSAGTGGRDGATSSRERGAAAGDQDEARQGSLPFTGLDLAVVVAMGGALLGTGFLLRRASRQPSA